MTTKQDNLKSLSLEEARRINNHIDCDVIQSSIEQVEKADTKEGLKEAMKYLIDSVAFRGGKIELLNRCLLDLDKPLIDCNRAEADEWVKKAEAGEVMRII